MQNAFFNRFIYKIIFYNKKTNAILMKNHSSFDLILANNVFAHVDDMDNFVEGIYDLLSEDGIFTFEVSYLLDVIKKKTFDTIYHEHVDYHSLRPLINFFKRFNH